MKSYKVTVKSIAPYQWETVMNVAAVHAEGAKKAVVKYFEPNADMQFEILNVEEEKGVIRPGSRWQVEDAINEIESIIEGLGGLNSWDGAAFRGCIEMARKNLASDTLDGDNYQERYEKALKEIDRLKKEVEEVGMYYSNIERWAVL